MLLTPSFCVLLQNFRGVFTAPSFRLFTLILTGWALSCRHRFITECNPAVVAEIDRLLEQHTEGAIAALLNAEGSGPITRGQELSCPRTS
jgi:hypothetical protein